MAETRKQTDARFETHDKRFAADDAGSAETDERLAETGGRFVTDERPPFGRSWGVLYAAVLLNLLMMILLFYIFTKAFA